MKNLTQVTVNTERKILFGLREMMGSHEGLVSRTKMMTQDEADTINKTITCIKWVCLDNDTTIKVL